MKKVPFLYYYPAALLAALGRLAAWLMQRAGWWRCGYCEKLHSPRVVAFDFSQGMGSPVCSHGLEAAGVELDGSEERTGAACFRICLDWDRMEKAARKMRRARNDHQT